MKTGIVACGAAIAVLAGGCATTRTTAHDDTKAEASRTEYLKVAAKAARRVELSADSPRVVVEYVDSPARRVTVTARRVIMTEVADSAGMTEASMTDHTSINKQTRTSGTRLTDHTSVWLWIALGLLVGLAVRRRGQHS